MTAPSGSHVPPTVVLVTAPGTLSEVDPALARRGVRPVRLTAVVPRPVPPARWLHRVLAGPVPDTVVVTSRAAVVAGVRPWRGAVGRLPKGTELWAVGPRTANALRAEGFRNVGRPETAGTGDLARRLDRGRPRTIVYFRSDRAGPGFARALRRRGHRVVDPVVYRLGPSASWTAVGRREIARADVVLVSSPSGLTELKRRLGPRTFSHLARNVRTVVLGARSLSRARELGFLRTSVSPSTAATGLTRHLLGELHHGPA